jgi:type I restriction-modification system DNA methylase subunit
MAIERQLQGALSTAFTELIKERNLEHRLSPYSVIEQGRADITLNNSNGKPLFFIELKDPTTRDGKTIFNSEVILRELERSQRLDVQYFGLCNFVALTLMDSKKLYDKASVNDGFFTVEEIKRLGQQENFAVTKITENKLKKIADFYIGKALELLDKKTIKANQPDEVFIFKIRKLIDLYAYNVTENIFELYQNDFTINQKITDYCLKQQWNKPSSYTEIENITHIALLMLIAKIIFYKAYQNGKTWQLKEFSVSENIETAEQLSKWIWLYLAEFKQVTNDFELLIGEETDILYQIPFVSTATIDLVKEIGSAAKDYDFSKLPYDIIGRIFEELIREEERHKLGQYFTPPDVIDLINAFCIPTGKETVLDPSCGSGTFLVRAYQRKWEKTKQMHPFLLDQVYGIDISGYATYLAMLNLSVRNMNSKSYPKVLHKDFFYLLPDKQEEMYNQEGIKSKKLLPQFDAIIGNPPYTRQEEINAFNSNAKGNIANLAKELWKTDTSNRTSIYAYFFYHAAQFLKVGGRLGFIVSSSWMDTDFGADLQQFLQKYFHIRAIIESSVERFFPSAEVHTNILLLEKKSPLTPEGGTDEITSNSTFGGWGATAFVYLHKPLEQLLKKYKTPENLLETFGKLNTDETDFKINLVPETALATQNKWSIFLKAPEVYHQILAKGKEVFVPLQELAKVRFGMKTGCNEYFYFVDKTEELKETEAPQPPKGKFDVITSTPSPLGRAGVGLSGGLCKELLTAINNTENITTIAELKKQKLRAVENGLGELWLIEAKFIKPVILSAREFKTYYIDLKQVKNCGLVVGLIDSYWEEKTDKNGKTKKSYNIEKYRKDLQKKYPYLYKYVLHGENTIIKEQIIAQKPTCKSRPAWWDLGTKEISQIVFPRRLGAIHKILQNNVVIGSDTLYDTYCKDEETIFLVGIFNSLVFRLFIEMTGREMTGAITVREVEIYELNAMLIPYKNLDISGIETAFLALKNQAAQGIFEVLDCKTPFGLDLSKVNVAQRNLDEAVLEAIGFTDKAEREMVLTQVYQSLIEIIAKRLEKTDSVTAVKDKRQSLKSSVDVVDLQNLVKQYGLVPANTYGFARNLQNLLPKLTADQKLQQKILSSYWQSAFNETYNEQVLIERGRGQIF